MLPDFVKITGTHWLVLPPGIYSASADELKERFAINPIREKLFLGLMRGLGSLKKAGCMQVYIDGSYVTSKPHPNDYDICWDIEGVNAQLLDPVMLDFSNLRAAQKNKYYGEYFPASFVADPMTGKTYLDFFRTEKITGQEKGIINIKLQNL